MKMKAVSLTRPWSELVVSGVKDVENRSWVPYSTETINGEKYKFVFRGPLLIHASKRWDHEAVSFAERNGAEVSGHHPPGAIVGAVEVIGVCPSHDSHLIANKWNMNNGYCWLLGSVIELPPFPFRGRLKLFDVEIPEEWEGKEALETWLRNLEIKNVRPF